MSNRYMICRRGDGKALESHDTLPAAQRALKILNAHEEENGRSPNYWFIKDEQPESSPANPKKGG